MPMSDIEFDETFCAARLLCNSRVWFRRHAMKRQRGKLTASTNPEHELRILPDVANGTRKNISRAAQAHNHDVREHVLESLHY